MAAIPQVLPSDPEDVVWALQTAETLWKRDERSDAIVWLRRAATAAGEAELDERALELSKIAADLSDQLKSPDRSIEIDVVTDEPSAPVAPVAPVVMPVPSPAALPGPSFPKPVSNAGVASPAPSALNKPPPLPPRKPPPPKAAPPTIPLDHVPPPSGIPGSTPAPPVATHAVEPPQTSARDDGPRRTDSGRFAIRADTNARSEVVPMPDEAPAVASIESLPPKSLGEGEIITVPPGSRGTEGRVTTANVAPRRNPSMTDIDAMADLPPLRPAASTPIPDGAPTGQLPAGEASSPSEPPAREPSEAPARAPSEPEAHDAFTADDPGRESVTPRAELAIEAFEAFADLPDDLRETLQKSAFVMSLKEGAEIPSFALAIVLAGDVDVAAHGVEAPAVRLPTGHVLYGRGSIESEVPMRLLGTGSGTGTEVAVWSRDDIGPIMKSCPWVEDDLRASADPVIAAVGVTIGSFGARLDPTLRGIVTARLAVHSLGAGDVLFPAGKVVPGLFVVGAGTIELVKDGAVIGTLGPGDFIFPGAVVGGSSKAQAEARAAGTGALVLSCDRKAAQELLMTCPPLLEILASM